MRQANPLCLIAVRLRAYTVIYPFVSGNHTILVYFHTRVKQNLPGISYHLLDSIIYQLIPLYHDTHSHSYMHLGYSFFPFFLWLSFPSLSLDFSYIYNILSFI